MFLSRGAPAETETFVARRDVWAIGVITYFLLCGYTPFDRDSNYEEMQAILAADYHFAPEEYWRGVSEAARDFIRRCLTIDQGQRMTAYQALTHPWIAPPADDAGGSRGTGADLLPVVRKNFNARRTLHAAIDTIRAINKLREGGAAGMMNGAANRDPERQAASRAAAGGQGQPHPAGKDGGDDRMDLESASGPKPAAQGVGDEMEVDGRGYGRGQTPAMIWSQERKIKETTQGLWRGAPG